MIFEHIQGNVFKLNEGYTAPPDVRARIDAIVKMRDQQGMKFQDIGDKFGISKNRALQIYNAATFKKQRDPMAVLKTVSLTIRSFLNQIADENQLPRTWENEPSVFLAVLQPIKKMTKDDIRKRFGLGAGKEILHFLHDLKIRLS